ncbi:MAG: sigma-70 family RNA polymerase sigma factor [Bauldia sp.]|nr:sigma-70 family RNA polymerase sigma factor [Bauldia sp.]
MLANTAELQRLLTGTATGKRDAFRSLYAATSPKLYAIVLRICREPGLAQDALQETYLKVWTRAERFRAEEGSPASWLAAIARNTAIDAVRRRTDVALGMDEEGKSVIEEMAMATEGADVIDVQALRHCLSGLEEKQRDCVVLAYCWGSSREELAEKFDRPVGTIKTWLHRGLANLKACLGAAA